VTIPAVALLLSDATTTTVATGHKAGTSLLDPIAKPIAGLLAEIYSVIPNYGIAILVLSLLWMIIISPLTLKSTRSMLAMQKLQPQLKKLQEQHKNDRQAFSQAQMELFREHQVSPFGSCLPMLLPLPVFFALFRVIQGLGRPNPKYLSHSTRMYQDIVAAHGHLNAFGMDLSQNAFSPHSSVWAALPFWILLLVMAGTGYLQSSQMMSRNPNAAQNPQMRMMKYLPLVFAVFFIRFPAGVLLYYAMSNVCRVVQQDAMYRFDPKVKALVNQEVQEVEAKTHDIDDREAEQQKKSPNKAGSKPPAAKTGPKPAEAKPPAKPPANKSGSKPPAAKASPEPAPAEPVPTAPTNGRSRFRDLLSAATAQQQQSPPASAPKAVTAGDPPKVASPAKPATTNGKKTSQSAPGNGQSSSAAKSAGTNGQSSPAKGQSSPAKGQSSPAKGQSAGGNGQSAATNGQSTGQAQDDAATTPTKSGHRTNRKRRR
jgi:YidC/Oxa1 family membrane protein insertase